MSTGTAGRKSKLSRISFTLALILLLSSIALPAAASPPQDLSFTFDVTYSPIPADEGFGVWSSGGLFSGSGDVYETYVIGGFLELHVHSELLGKGHFH